MEKIVKLDFGLNSRKHHLNDIKELEDIKPDILWNYIFMSPVESKDAHVNITYSDGQRVALKSGSGKNTCDIHLPFVNPEKGIQHWEDEMAKSSRETPTKIWTFHVINENNIHRIIMEETRNRQLRRSLEAVLPYIQANKDGIAWNDAEINIKGSRNQLWTIRSGIGKYEIEVYESKGSIQINFIPDEKIDDVSIKVPEINKRVLAKEMLKNCGNEASKRNLSLRKLFQAAIDQVDQYSESDVLRNAKMFFYDDKNNAFQIVSGRGKYQFIITDDGEQNPKVIIPPGINEPRGCCVM